jgi:hypothetical protein
MGRRLCARAVDGDVLRGARSVLNSDCVALNACTAMARLIMKRSPLRHVRSRISASRPCITPFRACVHIAVQQAQTHIQTHIEGASPHSSERERNLSGHVLPWMATLNDGAVQFCENAYLRRLYSYVLSPHGNRAPPSPATQDSGARATGIRHPSCAYNPRRSNNSSGRKRRLIGAAGLPFRPLEMSFHRQLTI